jgi:hypothetical protein
MKGIAVSLGSLALIAIAGAIFFGLYSRYAEASQPLGAVQLKSTDFGTADIPDDGSTYLTVVQIPFANFGAGTVQVTHLMSFIESFPPGSSTLTCRLLMDDVEFASKTFATLIAETDIDAGLTATTMTAPGRHNFSVACTSAVSTSGIHVRAISHGTSLIIVDR